VIEISGLSLRLGDFRLRDIALALDTGEVLVILGPNGAGKSVTLEAIAGFHRLDQGRIAIGGRDVTLLPPEHRHIGLVFQNFALFPHLTAGRNIAFGHVNGGRDPARLATELGIAGLTRRYPHQLSPGEKQRVALARALATEPELFLFDEPFSAIDTPTRDALRDELASFLRREGVPAIFVTHDRTDAMALADRVAVMRAGTVVQSGPATEVFAKPADVLVAALVGIENVLPSHIAGTSGRGISLAVAGRLLTARMPACATAAEWAVCIRAEDVALRLGEPPPGDGCINRLAGQITAITSLGPISRVAFDCGFPLVISLARREVRDRGLAVGMAAVAEIEPEAIHLARPGGA
jgi:molybdate/tungstate transport system ATP-binding protein